MSAHREGSDREETGEEEYEFADNEDKAAVEAALNAPNILSFGEDLLLATDNQAVD
jgi:hypothetical protein